MTRIIDTLTTAQDIEEIVAREVTRLKKKRGITSNKEDTIGSLEKLSRIHIAMRAAHRDDVKAGVYSDMRDEDLELLAGDEQADDLVDEDRQ